MWKPGDNQHSLLCRSEADGYPAPDFEAWYQQGMGCYQASLPKCLRKQAMQVQAGRWAAAGKKVALWHLRAFAYGTLGLDRQGLRPRYVAPAYEWPVPPDAAWSLVACCYPYGEIDLDFVHPVSGRFWSEDNGFLTPPEDHPHRFNRLWYDRMGFGIMVMMPMVKLVMAPATKHLQQV